MANNVAIFNNKNELLGVVQFSKYIDLNLRFLNSQYDLQTFSFTACEINKLHSKYNLKLINKSECDYDVDCTNKRLFDRIMKNLR